MAGTGDDRVELQLFRQLQRAQNLAAFVGFERDRHPAVNGRLHRLEGQIIRPARDAVMLSVNERLPYERDDAHQRFWIGIRLYAWTIWKRYVKRDRRSDDDQPAPPFDNVADLRLFRRGDDVDEGGVTAGCLGRRQRQ